MPTYDEDKDGSLNNPKNYNHGDENKEGDGFYDLDTKIDYTELREVSG